MSNINTQTVNVLSVKTDVELENQAGKTYTGFKITYEDDSGEPRKKVGHNNQLKYNKALVKDLATVKSGTAVLVMERKDGFNNLKRLVTPDKLDEVLASLSKSEGGETTTTTKSTGSNSSGSGYKDNTAGQ